MSNPSSRNRTGKWLQFWKAVACGLGNEAIDTVLLQQARVLGGLKKSIKHAT